MGPIDDLDVASPTPRFGSKVGIDATRKGPQEGYHREWPPDIEMSSEVRDRVSQRWSRAGAWVILLRRRTCANQ